MNPKVCKLTVLAEDVHVQKPILTEDAPGCPKELLDALITEFTDVLSDKPGNTEVVQLNLLTDTKIPISLPPYRIPERLSEKVEIAIQKLKDQGIIEHSTSPWSAPIVPIVKPSGDIRVCVDYRRLNNITAQEHYYMPELDDILGKIGNSCVLSKMDLVQGFHQITVADTSRDKTTFVCSYGRFRYVRMPFWLKNAPALFQRAIEIVLEPCRTFATSYIDDLVIFSNNWDDHLEHLRAVFTELRRHNLTAKPKKCVFGKRYLEYLGHLIGSGRLAVPQHRIAALEAYIKPKTAKDMHSFLGTMSYYRKFINGYANYSALLSPSTSKKAPRDVQWTPEMEDAFYQLKSKLSNVTILCVPSRTDTFILHTDASGLGVGAVLSIQRKGKEIPTAFFSRQLRDAERNYSTTEWEALAIVTAIHHFLPLLYGNRFTVVTDHKPLTSLMTSRTLNKRLHGWALKLAEFDFQIVYRSGDLNGNADGLSRQAWSRDEAPDYLSQCSSVAEASNVLSGGECGVWRRPQE